ncbi:MAG: fatty acid desaturase [Quisquiliibacterium sp.]
MPSLLKLPVLFFILSPSLGWWLGAPALGLLLGAVLIPACEWWLGRPGHGPLQRWAAQSQPQVFGQSWPRLAAALVLLQSFALTLIAAGAPLQQLVWLGLSLGFVAGGTGIVLGHELGHRRHSLDRRLSLALLTLVGYGHYQIEHNRGHHRSAATLPDPATARVHESLPKFFLRYYPGVWRGACALDRAERGAASGLGLPQRLLLIFAGYALLLALLAGPSALLLLAVQALIAQFLVGTIDYVEHWGLQRAMVDSRPQRFGPEHVWDCANRVSELMLFNLPRHAHHHLHPSDPADRLLRVPQAPQMPTGYAGMVLLASVPPLYRRVMSRRLPPPAS